LHTLAHFWPRHLLAVLTILCATMPSFGSLQSLLSPHGSRHYTALLERQQ